MPSRTGEIGVSSMTGAAWVSAMVHTSEAGYTWIGGIYVSCGLGVDRQLGRCSFEEMG